jgi:hypothetical protein
MQYIEHPKKLPTEHLFIPVLPSSSALEKREEKGLKDYSNRVSFFGILEDGFLTVYNKTSQLTIKSPFDFLHLIENHRHIFLVMDKRFTSVLWKGFSEKFKYQIYEHPRLGASETIFKIRNTVFALVAPAPSQN